MSARPRKYDVLSQLMTFHAFPDEVEGKYCLVEAVVPVGNGAPPNHHAGETEAFYILEGQVGFMVEGNELLATAGDFVPVPDGALHAFKAVGDTPARILILNAPGRMHEQFFTSIGTPLPDDQTDLPEPKEPDLLEVLNKAKDSGMTVVAPV